MRAGGGGAGGGCAVQQGLAIEAATVVKQAVLLAKRRGHAQVTPLHVASTMLSPSTGMFRLACQKSHSHPLQCKALELCFNVALNRLPAISPNPILARHPQYPSISNALLAAFKRAQAHQRRGSLDNNSNSQTVLSVKIELEQLVISILDDPSVSRVMKEAGFSSTQVKSNVEKAVSMDQRSRSSSPKPFLTLQPSSPPQIPQDNQMKLMMMRSDSELGTSKNNDVDIIFDALLMNRKKRSLVIVGESISTTEAIVIELKNRMDGGHDVPQGLKDVKFVTIPPLHSFCNLPIESVQHKVEDLNSLVKSYIEKGVVLYLGDLNWISECKLNLQQDHMKGLNSVEHMIVELGRLVCGNVGRVWLVGIATFRAYMRCRNGYDLLESIWGLQGVTIPVNTLGLSLVVSQSDCSLSRYEMEARNLQIGRFFNDDQAMGKHGSPRERSLIPFCSSSSSSTTSYFSIDQLQKPNLQISQPSIDLGDDVLPGQKVIIQEIIGTVLNCRSGNTIRRKNGNYEEAREETWLLFLGHDQEQSKREIARQLARVVFGSDSRLVSISAASTTEDRRGFIDRFAEAVSVNPHRVIVVEDLEEADDKNWRRGIVRAIERGRIGEEVRLMDAIVVLMSCNGEEEEEAKCGVTELDLNMSVHEEEEEEVLENIVDRKVVFGSPGLV